MGQRESISTTIITTRNQKEFISVEKVLKKIQSEPTYSQYTIQQQIELAKRLSMSQEIRKNYLRTNFTLHDPPILKIKTGRESSSIKSENKDCASDPVVNDTMSTTENTILEDHMIKIKLVISEVYEGMAMKQVRKIISPVISNSSRVPDFGLFHCSLLVGPWKLEWINTSLCIPRRCVTEKALLVIDIATIMGSENIVNMADKLAEFVADMNVNYEYAQQRSGDKLNCQDFIDLFFERFQLTPNFGKDIRKYLQWLRTKGKPHMKFKCDKNFRHTFQLKKSSYTFKTHEELDVFVLNLESIDPEWMVHWQDEYNLLKSFDRALWIRMFTIEKCRTDITSKLQENKGITPEEISKINSELEKFNRKNKKASVHTPLRRKATITNDKAEQEMVEELYCPFGNPQQTGSYSLHYLNYE